MRHHLLNTWIFASIKFSVYSKQHCSKHQLFTMSSKTVIRIISNSFWLSSSKLCLFSLQIKYYSGNLYVKYQRTSSHSIYFWRIFLIFSWLITAFELYCSLNCSRKKNLVKILYHFYLFIIKIACIAIAVAYQTKTQDIAQLLNCLWQKKSTFLIYKPTARSDAQNKLFTFSLVICTFGLFVFYLLFYPAIAFVLPCLHDNPLLHLLHICFSTTLFRLVVYFIQFAFMLPVAAMCISTTPVLLVALYEINKKLDNLW